MSKLKLNISNLFRHDPWHAILLETWLPRMICKQKEEGRVEQEEGVNGAERKKEQEQEGGGKSGSRMG